MTLNVILVLFTIQLNLLNAADIIVYPAVGANWTSTTFLIPIELPGRSFWPVCSKQSKFYCLSSYETDQYNDNPAVERDNCFEFGFDVRPRQIEFRNKLSVFTINAFLAADAAFLPMYQKHNFFVKQGYDCCVGQYNSYHHYGLQNLKIPPELYVSKITDYSEDNKSLNLIWSYYLKDCDINIVTKLGFGKGRLVRNHHKSGLFCHWVGRVFSLVGPKIASYSSRFLEPRNPVRKSRGFCDFQMVQKENHVSGSALDMWRQRKKSVEKLRTDFLKENVIKTR